jgi:hypothetical protein
MEFCPFEKLMISIDQDDAFNYLTCKSEIFETKDYLNLIKLEVDSFKKMTNN